MHEDVIHDVQPDYFGKRVATASSDKTVRIFETTGEGQAPRLIATLSGGHEGPVWAVAWAHPKFGSLLASCGYDGRVIIWKESAATGSHGKHAGSPSWAKLKEWRVEGGGSVNAVAWGPQEQGLVLAAAGSDGKASIYGYNPSENTWSTRQFSAHVLGCNAVSFMPHNSSNLMNFVVGNENRNGGGASSESTLKLVTGGSDNQVKVWTREVGGEEWKLEATLSGHSDWVRDVSWCPGNASLIASGSQDRCVFLWRNTGGANWAKTPLSADPFGETVWRVSWSVGGSLLAVATGDNLITVWREGLGGKWEQVNSISN